MGSRNRSLIAWTTTRTSSGDSFTSPAARVIGRDRRLKRVCFWPLSDPRRDFSSESRIVGDDEVDAVVNCCTHDVAILRVHDHFVDEQLADLLVMAIRGQPNILEAPLDLFLREVGSIRHDVSLGFGDDLCTDHWSSEAVENWRSG